MGQDEAPRIVVGAMSGTSADGVDVAVVRIAGRGPGMKARLLVHCHSPYDLALRGIIFRVRETGAAELAVLARAGRDISLTYARAVNDALAAAALSPAAVACVAAHGQTLYHDPPDTIQWLDPALLAAETGCAVVNDFRRADCAAGGQGAPLVPFADFILFRHPERHRVLLNLGGIANVTHLPAGAGLDRIMAFDTGPGNCVSDFLMRERDPAGPGYDANGAAAAKGVAIQPLAEAILSHPYFGQPPPKSTDGPAMIGAFQEPREGLGREASFESMVRTACQVTATSIADAIRRLSPPPDEVIASGGGTRNPVLMRLLREAVAPIPVRLTDEFGVPGAAKEAIAFALLGAATLDDEPSNVPAATGAARPAVLGSITPRPGDKGNAIP